MDSERLYLMADTAISGAFHNHLSSEREEHAILHYQEPREAERAVERAVRAAERVSWVRPRK